MVAVHLLKWCYFLQDSEGRDMELRYFRDVDRREVDFIILEEGSPLQFIECKTSGRQISPSLLYLKKRFPEVSSTQVLLEGDTDLVTKEGVRLCSANRFLIDFV